MKKLALAITCLCTSISANAIGVSGQGTWESTLQGRDLDGNLATAEAYYDTVLGITWLADVNYALTSSGYSTFYWPDANTWVTNLNPYGSGITGWRLPVINPINGVAYDNTQTFDGTTDQSYNISAPDTLYAGSTASELAHMFYVTLGNLAYVSISGSHPQPGWGLTNTGLFTNVMPRCNQSSCLVTCHWSASKYAPDTNIVWVFDFYEGIQYIEYEPYYNGDGCYPWAVHDGDVGTPIVETTDTDGDGISDESDNCPADANSSQDDYDSDDQGDVCDMDADSDGVANADDLCAQTPIGAPVEPSNGCSLAQLVPCDKPMGSSKPWRNHGQYVSLYNKTAKSFLKLGLINNATLNELTRAAAKSSCGKK